MLPSVPVQFCKPKWAGTDQLSLIAGKEGNAIQGSSIYGPMFGSGCDLYISNFANTQSSGSRLGVTYQLPPGQPNTFFTGATFFNVTDYEVFGLQQ